MKIAILTQPLGDNYGGILQNFALQTVLKKLGHTPVTIDYKKESKTNSFKRIFLNLLLFRPLKTPYVRKAPRNKQLFRFVSENIATTERFNPPLSKDDLAKFNFDAYIVGSDQIWRPRYSQHVPTYFLDFLKGDNSVKKIAYAASFGTDKIEFSETEIAEVKNLLPEFDAISVREDSAVELCKKYLKSKAIHLLDPTMLLEKDDYSKVIASDENAGKIGDNNLAKGRCVSYLLDATPEKLDVFDKVSSALGLEQYSIKTKSKLNEKIAVTEWLRAFRDSSFVVTDSFHGVVFSIIFNRPFIVISNSIRGASRFKSILKIFKLEDRLLENADNLRIDILKSPLDWASVNNIRNSEKQKALEFLKNNLTFILKESC